MGGLNGLGEGALVQDQRLDTSEVWYIYMNMFAAFLLCKSQQQLHLHSVYLN